ncbi:hypothetical protein ACFV7R_44050 [Streptomyces sp. NPDC059866]|uniref:hypothetical protein n=1 Tax=Streptomyces sp. NPDC059866 TaxID=3346978 RepID=UPI003654E998
MLLDLVPANTETWIQTRTFRLAAARNIHGIVAHSDPEPRTRLTTQQWRQLQQESEVLAGFLAATGPALDPLGATCST